MRRPALFAFILFISVPLDAEVTLRMPQSKIATSAAVRVRSAPEVTAKEVARVEFGRVVRATRRSAEKTTIGTRTDYWYEVDLSAGRSGWIFGGFLADYDPKKRASIVRGLIEQRIALEPGSFESEAEFYAFVAKELGAARGDERGALELARLIALSRTAGVAPHEMRDTPPRGSWLASHEKELVYSEPAGMWLARSDLFWELEKKYRGTALGERIAWAAAENGLPGECEGNETCYFHSFVLTEGRYLERYPQGSHAHEVILHLNDIVASEELLRFARATAGDRWERDARRSLLEDLALVRKLVAKTKFRETAAVLKRIDLFLGKTSGR